VDRVVRAARERKKFKVIVVMPAIPAFAGDLRGDDALGTRAIMNYQYRSISRGGRSIYDRIAQAGHNPMDYVRFYNLRNYGRINASAALTDAQAASGVPYGEASAHVDTQYGGGFKALGPDGESRGYGAQPQHRPDAATAYQLAAGKGGDDGRWDSVAECYMLNGPSIESVPWNGRPEAEMDAFVTEELYVHSKASPP
jgi:phospholipase D1/2